MCEVISRVITAVVGIAITPAFMRADVAAAGEPVEIGSWAQVFRAAVPELGRTSDKIELFLITSDAAFKTPAISGFSDAGWTGLVSSGERYVVTSGPATDVLHFTLSLLPDRSQPLALDVFQFGSAGLVDSGRLLWSGTGWTYAEAAPRSQYASAPETGGMLLIGTGLFVFGGLLRRRRLRA